MICDKSSVLHPQVSPPAHPVMTQGELSEAAGINWTENTSVGDLDWIYTYQVTLELMFISTAGYRETMNVWYHFVLL